MNDDSGNAIIEFLFLGVLILVPLLLGAASISVIHTAETAVGAGVREAARAYALYESDLEGRVAAQQAGALVISDFGVVGNPRFVIKCIGSCIGLASHIQVSGAVTVQVPFLSVSHTATATHFVAVRHP